jgi:pimeloyl-ACP methyl ester carboxylesterase
MKILYSAIDQVVPGTKGGSVHVASVAEGLAARGIASLLYDKRGVGESIGASHDLASWDDLAGDVAGAVRYLRSRADLIDPRRIGLIGQSQGTWIITKVAADDPQIRFLVNISGGGISAAEQETYRTGALMRVDGFPDGDIERATAFQRAKFAVARTGVGAGAGAAESEPGCRKEGEGAGTNHDR